MSSTAALVLGSHTMSNKLHACYTHHDRINTVFSITTDIHRADIWTGPTSWRNRALFWFRNVVRKEIQFSLRNQKIHSQPQNKHSELKARRYMRLTDIRNWILIGWVCTFCNTAWHKHRDKIAIRYTVGQLRLLQADKSHSTFPFQSPTPNTIHGQRLGANIETRRLKIKANISSSRLGLTSSLFVLMRQHRVGWGHSVFQEWLKNRCGKVSVECEVFVIGCPSVSIAKGAASESNHFNNLNII